MTRRADDIADLERRIDRALRRKLTVFVLAIVAMALINCPETHIDSPMELGFSVVELEATA